MTTLKQFAGICAIGAAASLTMTGAAKASPTWDYSFTDQGDGAYLGCRVGENCATGTYSNRDIIGQSKYFEIFGATVGRGDNNGADELVVDIFHNYVGDDEGRYNSLTKDSPGGSTPSPGIGFGDLFISNFTGDPADGIGEGTGLASNKDHVGSANNHRFTHALAFEEFDHRFSIADTNGVGGDLVLYTLDTTTADAYRNDLFLSEDFLKSGIFRNGQEVAVNTNNVSAGTVVGTWSVDDLGGNGVAEAEGVISFKITDMEQAGIADWTGMALKWGFTCANDSIEAAGNNQVPEPSIVALLGLGLLSIGVVRRRRVS